MFNTKLFGIGVGLVCLTPLLMASGIPVVVTGFNQDVVVEAGGSYPSSTTATMDGGVGAVTGNTWYGVGFNTTDPTTGLPTGLATSESDPGTTFQLEPFGENNALFLDSTHITGTFILASPAAYSNIALFGATGNGNGMINYVINYADASTQSGQLIVGDWFDGAPIAVTANGRVKETGVTDVNSGNPRLYQMDIILNNPNAALISIDFTEGSQTGHTALMAFSGTAIPEPGSVTLLVLGIMASALGKYSRGRTSCQ